MAQVLLVEDDGAIRTALTRALREQGHGVAAVSSGMPALSAAVEQKPDVVLLDLGLPDVDGADILSMLRESRAAVGLKSIFDIRVTFRDISGPRLCVRSTSVRLTSLRTNSAQSIGAQ